ncbi:hypothetical protein A1D23_09355 [Chelonobacter oris]|uniref:tRNA(Met) cytidine acetyltransferase TmcA n=1 Tax=Chelonobacter oris TaxID=505317 RepID=UPI00244CF569|nr:GNAT family N-acetyltransferase [Chelonobacter oris]MDH3000626.1 hypothetical protein [Chelonobacter oris]
MAAAENPFFRQTVILSGDDAWLQRQLTAFFTACPQQSAVYCAARQIEAQPENCLFYAFSQAKNLLGQEFDTAVYDGRQQNSLNFNLEALAIVAATVKAGGVLLILLPDWHRLAHCPDWDSLRWNGTAQASVPRHFYRWLQRSLGVHSISHYRQHDSEVRLPQPKGQGWQLPDTALQQQQRMLRHILSAQCDIYVLTAARGRGKSALAGMLAQELAAKQRVFLTAPNQTAVQTFYRHCGQTKPHFIAPDDLIRQLTENPQQFAQDWLIVDEAAMIPLDMLATICRHFCHILLTGTTHGYEGTGRGFELKLTQRLDRTWQFLHLSHPLRYPLNDPLEQWINALLLLDREVMPSGGRISGEVRRFEIASDKLRADSRKLTAFYRLLTLAHYRTSPLDLRRLLDADGQRFWIAKLGSEMVAGIWALEEGGMTDSALIERIWLGERRPKGNLLVQALCFQADLPQACELHSLRISRIAVLPHLQRQGFGKRLLQQLIEDCRTEPDFISVSFGYSEPLAAFWQKCGFELIHLSHGTEASSGCYSAMAIYPLSPDGERFCRQAQRRFLRHFPLAEHPLLSILQRQIDFPEIDWLLNADDLRQLHGFADANRTLASTRPALSRLIRSRPHLTLSSHLQNDKLSKKQRLMCLRQALSACLAEEFPPQG